MRAACGWWSRGGLIVLGSGRPGQQAVPGQVGAIAHLLALLGAGGDRWRQARGWGPGGEQHCWAVLQSGHPAGRGHAWLCFCSWATLSFFNSSCCWRSRPPPAVTSFSRRNRRVTSEPLWTFLSDSPFLSDVIHVWDLDLMFTLDVYLSPQRAQAESLDLICGGERGKKRHEGLVKICC